MEKDALLPKPTSSSSSSSSSLWSKQKDNVILFLLVCFTSLFFLCLIAASVQCEGKQENHVPYNTTILSMNFRVLNITESRLSTVQWDLLIRLPRKLMPIGDYQVLIVYKGVTIATSSIERYNFKSWKTRQLNVSLIASVEDMDGVIVKDITEDIKERGEIRFGSRLNFTYRRYRKKKGKLNYACDEATLRFEPGSQRNATLIENQPNCLYLP